MKRHANAMVIDEFEFQIIIKQKLYNSLLLLLLSVNVYFQNALYSLLRVVCNHHVLPCFIDEIGCNMKKQEKKAEQQQQQRRRRRIRRETL